jgi:hypothetical protein
MKKLVFILAMWCFKLSANYDGRDLEGNSQLDLRPHPDACYEKALSFYLHDLNFCRPTNYFRHPDGTVATRQFLTHFRRDSANGALDSYLDHLDRHRGHASDLPATWNFQKQTSGVMQSRRHSQIVTLRILAGLVFCVALGEIYEAV